MQTLLALPFTPTSLRAPKCVVIRHNPQVTMLQGKLLVTRGAQRRAASLLCQVYPNQSVHGRLGLPWCFSVAQGRRWASNSAAGPQHANSKFTLSFEADPLLVTGACILGIGLAAGAYQAYNRDQLREERRQERKQALSEAATATKDALRKAKDKVSQWRAKWGNRVDSSASGEPLPPSHTGTTAAAAAGPQAPANDSASFPTTSPR